MVKCGIFILTQNNVERKIYLKTCLYFLFKNYNKNYNYDVVIMHEGDYDERSQQEIIRSIREKHRGAVKFLKLDNSDFSVPSHIDEEKLEKCLQTKPVPYWRNKNYRMMCYFWVKNFFKYTQDYDYVMRLDDDSIIEEPLKEDLFEIMKNKDLVYLSNIVHVDCGVCNYGMKELFLDIFPDKRDKIEGGLFIKATLNNSNKGVFDKLNDLHLINYGKPIDGDTIDIHMPVMYYNNFFVTSTKFWRDQRVQDVIDKIDKNGGIFYYRYGDAPLHTLIVTLMEPTRISRAVFKYSKRLQREVFIDDDKVMHSYMPKNYEHSSCITNN